MNDGLYEFNDGFTTWEGNNGLCDHFDGGKRMESLDARFFLEDGIIYLIVKLFICRQTKELSIYT
jgi:regulator of sigma D